MSSLVQTVLTLRRTTRAGVSLAAAGAMALLVVLGVFTTSASDLGFEHALVAAAWISLFVHRLASRTKTKGESTAWTDLELGALLLVAAHAAVQFAGGTSTALYPIVYVVVALVASFAEKPAGHLIVAFAVALELAVQLLAEDVQDVRPLLLHLIFLISFGLLNIVFTRVEIARVRETSKKERAAEKEKVREDAKLYRLVGAATENARRDEERAFRSSLEEVHQSLYHVLDLLRRTMAGHTCVLFLVEGDGDTMRIAEASTEGDDLATGSFSSGEGAVGAVVQRAMPMFLENIKPGYKGLPYYREPATVKSFLGVPILEGQTVRGVLCIDRVDGTPFLPRDEQLLQGAVQQVERVMKNERVFLQLERSKHEQGVLYRASQALGAALTEDGVAEAGLTAAAEISPFEFAAITLYDSAQKKHSVRKAVGEGAAQVTGLSFRDNTSLTSMAVKNKHYLPYRGDFDATQHVVFTRKSTFDSMQSMLILPLVVREDAIGTLCLAAKRPGAFGEDVRPTLQMLGNQLAIALANAASVRRLEELATTDGLTGCLNKRAFLDELDKRIRSAERFGKNLSMVITDIDKFKAVNDTYGHGTGDVVIKGLGEILRKVKRETDIVARFGGEEFVVLCEETDTEGARLLAERIREELMGTPFQTENGPLRVTCSLGVSTFPMHAKDSKTLFDVADKALYVAKQGGRNRVCLAG
jgi:two-component system cell cycle response regulator